MTEQRTQDPNETLSPRKRSEFVLSQRQMRQLDDHHLASEIAYATEAGRPLRSDMMDCVFLRTLDAVSGYSPSMNGELTIDISSLPVNEDEELDEPLHHVVYQERDNSDIVIVEPGEMSRFPIGIVETQEATPLLQVTLEAFAELDTGEKRAFLDRMLAHLDILEHEEAEHIFDSLIDRLKRCDDREAVYDGLFHYLSRNKSRYLYDYFIQKRGRENHVDMVAMEVCSRPKIFLRNALELDDEELLPLLGIMVDVNTYTRSLNMIRERIRAIEEDESLDAGERARVIQRLGRIGKILIGVEDPDDTSIPFHTSLEDLYARIKFEEYKPNEAALENDLAIIEMSEQLVSSDLPEDMITLDNGCGTGRLANPLAERGHGNIVAIDTSDRNLEVAREDWETKRRIKPDIAPVDYRKASLLYTGLPEKSVRYAFSLGRTLPHLEDAYYLEQHLMEMDRVMPTGGVYVFDMPQRRTGTYLKNRLKLIPVFRKIGLPIDEYGGDEELQERIEYLVDGPDSTNQYNRLAVSNETLRDLFAKHGFRLTLSYTYPVGHTDGDTATVYRAQKMTDDTMGKHLHYPHIMRYRIEEGFARGKRAA